MKADELLDHTKPWTVEQMIHAAEVSDIFTVKKAIEKAEVEPDGFFFKILKKSRWYAPMLPKHAPGDAFEGQRVFRAAMNMDYDPANPDPAKHLIDWYITVCEDLGIDISGDAAESKEEGEEEAPKKKKEASHSKPAKSESKPAQKSSRRSLKGPDPDDNDDDVAPETEEDEPPKSRKAADAPTETPTMDLSALISQFGGLLKETEDRLMGGIQTSTDTITAHVTSEHEQTRSEAELAHARNAVAMIHLTGRLLGDEEEKNVGAIYKLARKTINTRLDEFDPKDSPLYGK